MELQDLQVRLYAIGNSLDGLQNPWALVGGMAVATRAEPSFTRDIDIAVAVRDDKAAERVIYEIARQGYRPIQGGTIEQVALGRLSTQRLMPPGGKGVIVDLLFCSSGIEAEVVGKADRLEVVAGVRVPVATCGHLIALKTLSLDDRERPRDRVHLKDLLACATPVDMAEAREALSLIEERGCNRQKDLQAELEKVCRRHAPHLALEHDHGMER